MGKQKSPRREFCSVEFRGFLEEPAALFRRFSQELINGGWDRTLPLDAPLRELLEQVLEFRHAKRFSPTTVLENFSLEVLRGKLLVTATGATEESHENFTKALDRARLPLIDLNFTYDGIPRLAYSGKIYSWGFRGRTAKGPRNFAWEKVDLTDFSPRLSEKPFIIHVARRPKGLVKEIEWRTRSLEGLPETSAVARRDHRGLVRGFTQTVTGFVQPHERLWYLGNFFFFSPAAVQN